MPPALGAQNLSPLDHEGSPFSASLSQTQALVTQLPLHFATHSLGAQELSAAFHETLLNLLLSPLAWKSSWRMPT